MDLTRLATHGVCVVYIGGDLHKKVPAILAGIKEITNLQKALDDLPFPVSPERPEHHVVLGGFGATGLPSNTHHPATRAIRAEVYDRLLPGFITFAAAFPDAMCLEALFDRFSIRRKGSSTSPESWHRDVGPKAPGDIIYGGWVNLDPPGTAPQMFSCLPGNTLPAGLADPQGFAKFKKEEFAGLNAALKQAGGPLAVPPGHLIIFDQSIAHKITGKTAECTSYRLYCGWRLTQSTLPLYDKDAIITEQSVPPLPSGQRAPMYAKLHQVNWADRLEGFSRQFRPEFLDPARGDRVARFLPGLVATGHAFPPYTAAERAIFFPRVLRAEPQAVDPPTKRQCF